MPACRCGAEVAYVYDVDDDLIVIDAERSEFGNVAVREPATVPATRDQEERADG